MADERKGLLPLAFSSVPVVELLLKLHERIRSSLAVAQGGQPDRLRFAFYASSATTEEEKCKLPQLPSKTLADYLAPLKADRQGPRAAADPSGKGKRKGKAAVAGEDDEEAGNEDSADEDGPAEVDEGEKTGPNPAGSVVSGSGSQPARDSEQPPARAISPYAQVSNA